LLASCHHSGCADIFKTRQSIAQSSRFRSLVLLPVPRTSSGPSFGWIRSSCQRYFSRASRRLYTCALRRVFLDLQDYPTTRRRILTLV
jgi:hypothetical protein